jgi:hypothetical protein
LCWAVPAEAVERHDRADPLPDRLLARDAVGGGGAFLELADLIGHRGGELLAPAGPRKRLVVQEQERAGGVARETAALDLGLEVQHDALVAKADAEVLQAAVASSGLRQRVVELIAVHGDGVTARGPKRGLAAAGAMIVVEHPPVRERVAQLQDTCGEGVSLEVVVLAVDVLELSELLARVRLADEHLDSPGEAQEAALRWRVIQCRRASVTLAGAWAVSWCWCWPSSTTCVP